MTQEQTPSVVTHQEIQEFALWEKMRTRRLLYSFQMEITARCNNHCRHCYINLPADDRAAQRQELTLAEISRIAGEAAELGAVRCLITGGEPLLRPDFGDIYLTLKRMGLLVSVFTNATLVRPEHVQLFKQYPPRDIEVTVYGVTQGTYEAISRRPGSFAAFRRGLDLLLDGGVRVRLKTMALRSNLRELPEIDRFCESRTKDYYRYDAKLFLRLDGNPYRNAEIRAERLSLEDVVALDHTNIERSQAMHDHCEELTGLDRAKRDPDHIFACGAGLWSFQLGYDGRYRLCTTLCAPGTTYDLRTGTVRDAFEHLVPRVRALRSQRQEFLERCRRCPIINLCQWCPGNACLETGELDGWVEGFCRVAHARARALGYDGQVPNGK